MTILSKSRKKILKHLAKQPDYGYSIGRKNSIPLPSVYELLKDLEKENFIKIYKELPERNKKIYRLTAKGRKLLELL